MKSKFWRLSAGVLLVSGLLLQPVLAGPPKPEEVVGKVTSVEGSKLEVQRAGAGKWLKTKVDEPSLVKDHFKTDSKTSAAIDLFVGARVGVKKSSEIVLLGEGDAAVVENGAVRKIQVKSGGVWAKFDKQDKAVTIQTRGGVMGIKGTEFTVDTTEDGRTDVVLLEGSVDYKEDKADGKTFDMVPGQKLSQFDKDGETYTVKGEPEQVDKSVADFISGAVGLDQIDSVQDVLNRNWSQIPSDVVNGGINALRQKTLDSLGIPPEIQSLVSTYVYDASGYTNYVNNVLPNLSIPGFSVPGVSIPGIGWP